MSAIEALVIKLIEKGYPMNKESEAEMTTNKEVMDYFFEQYEGCSIRVVPGHWPDFKTKDEVDLYLRELNSTMLFMDELFKTPSNE